MEKCNCCKFSNGERNIGCYHSCDIHNKIIKLDWEQKFDKEYVKRYDGERKFEISDAGLEDIKNFIRKNIK